MSYPFSLHHSLPERTRIRWSGASDERGQVEALASRIAELPGVHKTDARLRTGSIVIEHETLEWEQLAQTLQAELGLDFVDPAAPASGLEAFNRSVGSLERELKKADIDLNSLAFLFLLLMAVAQTARGQIGVSGFSFLWYALNVASRHRGDAASPDAASEGQLSQP